MRRAFVFCTLVLAACGGKSDQATLTLACQTEACTCTDKTQPLFGSAATTPIRWKQNGNAYCAKDFELRRVGE